MTVSGSDYGLQMEMASAGYILAMTTVGDSPEGFERLAEALETIDFELQRPGAEAKRRGAMKIRAVGKWHGAGSAPCRSGVWKLTRAVIRPTEEVPLEEAAGRVMGDYLYLYPPGVPMLVRGSDTDETY